MGIPNTRDGFRRARERRDASFASGFLGGWPQYYAFFMRDLEAAEPIFLRLGVTILHDASLEDFAGVLARSNVVLLFSHWYDGEIEFNGGFKSIGAVVTAISPAYSGILDLCVCHPWPLVKELSIHRPNCLIRYSQTEASPHYWLHFYRILFIQLQCHDLTYLQAIEKVTCAILDWALPKSEKPDAKRQEGFK